MGVFAKRKKPFDRARLLSAASKAQSRRRYKKALALYQEVFKTEPNNPELHRRIAPLLVRTKQREKAWVSFRFAAEALAHEGFLEKAIGIYREAAHYLPREVGAWLAIAELHVQRERSTSAVEALLEGRVHFRRRKHRPEAVRLLARAHEIDPSHFGAAVDLARLLQRTGNRRLARQLLRDLAPRCHRRQLLRLRAVQFRLCPTPAAGLRWFRALLTGR
jgi:tetratricopeptide (TPR) repeat protein